MFIAVIALLAAADPDVAWKAPQSPAPQLQFPGAGVGAAVGIALSNLGAIPIAVGLGFFLNAGPLGTAGAAVAYGAIIIGGSVVGTCIGSHAVGRALVDDTPAIAAGAIAGVVAAGATFATIAVAGSSPDPGLLVVGSPLVGVVLGGVTAQLVASVVE